MIDLDIGIALPPEARRVELKFEKFPQEAHDELLDRLTKLTDRLKGRIEATAPYKTGKLRTTIESRIYDDKDRLRGRVTVTGDFAKAATLEYGSHKSIKVGLPPGRERARQAHRRFSLDLTMPTAAVNAAFSRQMNVVARRWLRGPLAEMAGEAVAELRAGLEAAAAKP